MDEFTDNDLQVSPESDDDSRILLTVVSMSGRKITLEEYLDAVETYIHKCRMADLKRRSTAAVPQ